MANMAPPNCVNSGVNSVDSIGPCGGVILSGPPRDHVGGVIPETEPRLAEPGPPLWSPSVHPCSSMLPRLPQA